MKKRENQNENVIKKKEEEEADETRVTLILVLAGIVCIAEKRSNSVTRVGSRMKSPGITLSSKGGDPGRNEPHPEQGEAVTIFHLLRFTVVNGRQLYTRTR